MRECKKCGKLKENEEFAKHHWCRKCAKEYNRNRKVTKRAQLNKNKNEWAKKNPKLRHKGQSKSKYSITGEQYDAIYSDLCAVCGKPETDKRNGKIRMLSIDHNHDTGKIRGMLCGKCNKALGLLDENIDILLSMIKYIAKHT
jgi:uncharacterized membrane protein YvbJ